MRPRSSIGALALRAAFRLGGPIVFAARMGKCFTAVRKTGGPRRAGYRAEKKQKPQTKGDIFPPSLRYLENKNARGLRQALSIWPYICTRIRHGEPLGVTYNDRDVNRALKKGSV